MGCGWSATDRANSIASESLDQESDTVDETDMFESRSQQAETTRSVHSSSPKGPHAVNPLLSPVRKPSITQRRHSGAVEESTTTGGDDTADSDEAEAPDEPTPAAAFGNGGHDSIVEFQQLAVQVTPTSPPQQATVNGGSSKNQKNINGAYNADTTTNATATVANPLAPQHSGSGNTTRQHHHHHHHHHQHAGGSSTGGSIGPLHSGSNHQVADADWRKAEDELSDISVDNSSSTSCSGSSDDDLFNIKPMQFHHLTKNLDEERAQAIPTIEEEFFEYDDVKISKDEAKSKQWRVAGRKGTMGAGAMMTFLQKPDRESVGGSSKKFAFADFLVAIDEVDAVDTLKDSSNRAKSRLSLATERPKATKLDYVPVRRFEVVNLLGHASRVKCIAIAPGEREFVSCSNEDASVTLCNIHSDKEIGIFTGHQDTVINATFSHDGKYLATTSRDHTMILWDVVTAKQLLTFDHAKVVICCCFSRDSKYIATGCQDKICRLWETRKGRECLIFAQHEGIIISLSYSPDSTFIVSASADKTLRVWSTTTGKCKYVLTGHQGIVLSCHYTNDGKCIVSNDEQLVKVWSTADGSCTRTVVVDELCGKLRHTLSTAKKLTWTLSCVAPGEFTRYFFVACNNRFVYLLDIETGEEVFSVFCKAPVYCLASGFSQLGAFGDSFGNIYLIRIF